VKRTLDGHDTRVGDDETGRDWERVASRAESLAQEEQGLEIDDIEEQAAALLAESDERAEDPDTMELTGARHERRTAEETVEPL
jgi:hypothetical protein